MTTEDLGRLRKAEERLAKLPKAWVAKRQEVSEDLFVIWLRTEVPVPFKAGQYITIGKGGIERPYSIASAPYEKLIELFIEYVLPEFGGKLTPILWEMHVGEHVSMRPKAKGIFTFQPQYHNHVMVGTVTGVAPFVSILRQSERDGVRGHRFFVMEGASHQDEFVYDTELERLAAEHPGKITYIMTVSRPNAERNQSWAGPTGRVNTLVEEYLAKWSLPKDDTVVYLCGNPGMIEDVRQRLEPDGWNLLEERFWKEEDE